LTNLSGIGSARRFPTALLVIALLPTTQACGTKGESEPVPAPSASSAVALSASLVPPEPAGPILDQANILPAASEAALEAHLRDIWVKEGNAIIVVSVASLGGQSIETYANSLFNQWGIGDKKTNRGLLVLVAPNEHMVRIEVGCGLESAITDQVAAQIVDEDMLPAFRQGHLEGGTLAGVQALERTLAANPKSGPRSEICRKLMKEVA
jgi:uncharacterized protein